MEYSCDIRFINQIFSHKDTEGFFALKQRKSISAAAANEVYH